MSKTPSEQIAEYKAKIAELKQAALEELHAKRREALATLQGIEEEIKMLIGEEPPQPKRGRPAKAKTSAPKSAKPAKKPKSEKAAVPDAKTLKALLGKADGTKLNRKGFNDQGYSLKSAITLAKEDGKTFGFKQNGPQGEVWLK